MQYLIEIVLTHDHHEGQRLPDCFQAMLVPLSGTPVDGGPEWESARPLTPPVMCIMATDDDAFRPEGTDLFGRFLQMVGNEAAAGVLGRNELGEPERIEFSLEGPDDCVICSALTQQELVSQGKLP